MSTIQTQETQRRQIDSVARAEDERIAAGQQLFEASEKEKKQALIQLYVPKMLSKDTAEQLAAIAILQELLPDDAPEIRKRLAAIVDAQPRSEATAAPSAAATPTVPTTAPAAPTPLTGTVYPTPATSTAASTPAANTAVATATPEEPQARPTTSPLLVALNSAVAPRTDWRIVAGSDADLPGAEAEVERARRNGYNALAVYKRQGWFATTIGSFPSETDAKSANIGVRAKIRDSAFVVDLASWCPSPEHKEPASRNGSYDYAECPSSAS